MNINRHPEARDAKPTQLYPHKSQRFLAHLAAFPDAEQMQLSHLVITMLVDGKSDSSWKFFYADISDHVSVFENEHATKEL